MKKTTLTVLSMAVIGLSILGALPLTVHAEASAVTAVDSHLRIAKKKVFMAYGHHKISQVEMKSLAKRIKDVQKEEKKFYQSNGEKTLTEDQKSQLNASLDSIESSI